jgi:hypothetical protein
MSTHVGKRKVWNSAAAAVEAPRISHLKLKLKQEVY